MFSSAVCERLAAGEAADGSEDEEAHDNGNEVLVIEKRNHSVHNVYVFLDVVTTKRETEQEKDYPRG